jgi:hypothetical protein
MAYYAGKIVKPRLEFRALRIDLSEPGLRIVVYDGDSPGKTAGLVPGTWVSGFVRNTGLLAGINAAPFDPVSGKEGKPTAIVGITVAEGVLVSPPEPRFDALVFYYGGGAAVVSQGDLGNLERIQNAVGGFHRVLEQNRLPGRLGPSDPNKASGPRHPRSAAGLSADGKFLYLLAIDGRQLKSIGATEAETGIILRQLGASEGINLDGGGSTSLALRFPDGAVRVVNTPIHGGIPGRERAVASCLGIGLAPKTD